MKKKYLKNTFIPAGLLALTALAVAIYPYMTVSGNTSGSGTVRHPVTNPAVNKLPAILPGQLGGELLVAERPKIEVVFVLDTTSSMSGMIQAAKDNIWSIASTMASAQPAPEINMGLVAFRDRGDAYVTKVFDLSEDLDSMYATLMDFKAQGGGDGPESVNQALYDAVTKISWSQDPDSYQVVFLVGDAPPHTDYQNDVKYPESIKLASEKGIVINTIQAGTDSNTANRWQKIASLSQGNYFNVAQNNAHVAVATPFDKKIAEISEELDRSRVFYGSKADKVKQELKVGASKKLHEIASVASRAKRALFNASESGASNFTGDKELVADIAAGTVALEDIAEAELPEAIRNLPIEERESELRRQSEKRDALKAQITLLAKKREDYVATEVAKEKDLDESLDHQIFETVAEQTKSKGMRYEGGPKY